MPPIPLTYQKSPSTTAGYYGYKYELSNHLNTFNISFAPVCALQTRRILLFQIFFEKSAPRLANSSARPSRVRERGQISPPPWVRKGVRTWNLTALNGKNAARSTAFCKTVLRNEAIDAIRERKYRRKHEVSFSELSPQEENQLYTCDQYFANDEAEKSFLWQEGKSRQKCLPTRCTLCRKKNVKPYCFITSLT